MNPKFEAWFAKNYPDDVKELRSPLYEESQWGVTASRKKSWLQQAFEAGAASVFELPTETEQWAYSMNGDDYTGGFASQAEAFDAASDEAEALASKPDCFYTAKVLPAAHILHRECSKEVAENFLEDLNASADTFIDTGEGIYTITVNPKPLKTDSETMMEIGGNLIAYMLNNCKFNAFGVTEVTRWNTSNDLNE